MQSRPAEPFRDRARTHIVQEPVSFAASLLKFILGSIAHEQFELSPALGSVGYSFILRQ